MDANENEKPECTINGQSQKLTRKQKLFCEEYIIDLNGTQSAIRAGYSKATAGEIAYENLKKPDIQNYINQTMAERTQKTEVTADKVVEGISEIAFYGESESTRLKALELLGKLTGIFDNKPAPIAVTVVQQQSSALENSDMADNEIWKIVLTMPPVRRQRLVRVWKKMLAKEIDFDDDMLLKIAKDFALPCPLAQTDSFQMMKSKGIYI